MSEQTKRQTSEAHRMRSRRSILAENDLRSTLKKIQTATAVTERRVREGEERVAWLTKKVVVEGLEVMRGQLDEAMRDVATRRDLIKSCRNQHELTQAEIEKLTPGPEQRAIRQHQQELFTELINKRLAKDRQVDQLLEELREVLRERGRLTAQMAEPSAALELTISGDGLDTAGYEGLLASLPGELLSQSERWSDWFLGRSQKAKPYMVCVEHLLVLESLVDNGLYHFGDLIYLEEEQASDLLCDDYYAGPPAPPWRCQPPKVMTMEAFEAAAKNAQEKGLSIQEVCFWMDAERNAKNRQWFKDNGTRKTMKQRAVSAKDNIVFESTEKIRIKYKGEITEVIGRDRALQSVEAGSAGPV